MRTTLKATRRAVPLIDDDLLRFERIEPTFGSEHLLELDDDLIVSLGDDDIHTTCSDHADFHVDTDDADTADWEYESLRWH